MTTVPITTPTRPYVADPRLIAAITGRPVSEVRIHPMHLAKLQPCDTCRTGCDCDGAAGDLSCGHYACWGRSRRPAPEIDRCPGVAYEKARSHVLSGERAQDQIRAARRRGPDVLRRVINDILTQHGLVTTDGAA